MKKFKLYFPLCGTNCRSYTYCTASVGDPHFFGCGIRDTPFLSNEDLILPFHFDADPNSTFHFHADLGPASYQNWADLQHRNKDPPRLYFVWASTALHGGSILNLYSSWFFTFVRIRAVSAFWLWSYNSYPRPRLSLWCGSGSGSGITMIAGSGNDPDPPHCLQRLLDLYSTGTSYL